MPFDFALFSVVASPGAPPHLTLVDCAAPDAAPDAAPEPLLAALSGVEIETAWNGIIDAWAYASDEEVLAARQFIGTVRDRVIDGLSDTVDAADFQTASLLAFTRLKAFWFELNSRIGFHLEARTGNVSIPLRAGLVAGLLNTMEPHLPENATRKVDSFLSAVVSDDMDNLAMMSNQLLPGPAEVRVKINQMLGTIESLSASIIAQEAELYELKTGQIALQKALGEKATFGEIAARMNALNAKVTGLEAQTVMEEVYQNVLGQALGTTDPLQVVKEVRRLRDDAKRWESERFQMERENERVAATFGDLSAGDALDGLRDAKQETVTAQAENDALQIRLAAQAERTESVTAERDALLKLLDAPDVAAAETALRTLHENAAAYRDIASLLGDVGKELGKIGG